MTFRATLLMTVALCFCFGAMHALAGGKGSSNADCSAQTAGMSDAEREAFMAACVSGNKAATPVQSPAPAPTQQDNKSACQAQAQSRGLQGNERKTFMADCLGGSGGD